MGMHDDVYHQGKSLAEWQLELNGEYSLGELYRMAKDGADLSRFVLEKREIVSEK